MSLPYEYFKNKEHIKDLNKIRDVELHNITQAFHKESEKLNNIKNTQLKDLKKLCDETTEIIKRIEFILSNYKNVYQKNNYEERKEKYNNFIKKGVGSDAIIFYERGEAIHDMFYEIDNINYYIQDFKKLKINSTKAKSLIKYLSIFIRSLDLSISELD